MPAAWKSSTEAHSRTQAVTQDVFLADALGRRAIRGRRPLPSQFLGNLRRISPLIVRAPEPYFPNGKTGPDTVSPIESRIRTLRGTSVVLDADLADLYGVETRTLLQAVRRNRKRFPSDFIFRIKNQELMNLRSQVVISSLERRYGGRRYLPWAFTEQGVAMLSSVLRSETAVRVNIEIMRAFVRLRRAALASERLMPLIEDLSKRVDSHDAVIADLVDSIRQIVEAPSDARPRPIGFTADLEDPGN